MIAGFVATSRLTRTPRTRRSETVSGHSNGNVLPVPTRISSSWRTRSRSTAFSCSATSSRRTRSTAHLPNVAIEKRDEPAPNRHAVLEREEHGLALELARPLPDECREVLGIEAAGVLIVEEERLDRLDRRERQRCLL